MPKKLKTIKETEDKKLINFKATEEEEKAILANAKKYAGGNMSAWIRFASQNFIPKASDLK